MTFNKTTLTLALIATAAVSSHAYAKPLNIEAFNTLDPKGFQVSSVLISGQKDAVLLDGQFTLPDAQQLVEKIKASGKTLKTVFVTAGDPDYYFGLEVIKAAFPNAKILTTPATLKHIEATLPAKLKTWGPQLGEAGPKNVVMPKAFAGNSLRLEGQKIEIKHGVGLMKDDIYMYIPSSKAVVGGVMVYGGLHVWTADTQSLAQRQDWVKSLNAIAALKPKMVVPGHYQAGSPLTLAAVKHTHDYLIQFDQALPKAANAAELIDTMKKLYPNAGSDISIDIGSKVNKGEMKW